MEPRASSFGVAFRAMLMLACLVAIPIFALGKSALPDSLKGLLGDRWLSLPPAALQPTAAPDFKPVPPTTLNPNGPMEQRIDPMRAAWPTDRMEGATSPVTPAAYQSPIAAPGGPPPSPFAPALATLANDDIVKLRPPMQLGDGGEMAPVELPATPGASRDPQFAAHQEQLRQLGATYFLLESWGDQQQLFRFYCKVAVGGNPNCTRHFEATDADPLVAMANVVKQVDDWRSHRL